ncbi:hypothetical protein Esti_000620 [Eimeria stiedai]
MAQLYRDDSDFWTQGDSSGSDDPSGDECPPCVGIPSGAPQGLASSAGAAGANCDGSLSAVEVLPPLTAFIPPPLAVPPVSAEALEELQQLRLLAENTSSSSSSNEQQKHIETLPEPVTAWESDLEGGEEGLNFLPQQQMQQQQQHGQQEQQQEQQDYAVHDHHLLLPMDLLGDEGEAQGPPKFRINFELMEDVPTNINPYAAPAPVIECEPPQQQQLQQQQEEGGSVPSAAGERVATGANEPAGEGQAPRRPKAKAIRKKWCIDDVADVAHFRQSLREIRKERAAAAAAAAAARQQQEQQQQAAGDSSSSAALECLLRAQVAPPPDAATAAAAVAAAAAASASGAAAAQVGAAAAGSQTAAAAANDADLTAEEEPLALEFGFPLDDFQKRAILRLEKNQCVFVAAHTSAGKTVVAEYAIALAMQRRRRCVFTSPLKALSNQKYREFKQKFGSTLWGLFCLAGFVLCRGDELIGQLDCAVFDEAHYANDAERGVVWEESLILLPQHINIILLSATLPNYREFCDWLGAVKQREVFAQTTSKRPTPLRHFLYSRDKPFLLIDEGGTFNAAAYSQAYAHVNGKKTAVAASAKAAVQSRGGGSAGVARGAARAARGCSRTAQAAGNKLAYQSSDAKLKTESQRLQTLIRYLAKAITKRAYLTRRKCEAYAKSLTKVDVTLSQLHRSRIHLFTKECLKRLSPADRELRQIDLVLKLAQRGIGIHHGGLLPIIKEMVEILFQRGLVRVLFATETLAVGLNMPARTVVFTDTKKHDGERLRPLLASEYTQMAGRAGRRGIDSCGNVYVFAPDEDLTTMMVEKATPMASRFRLTYQTLLQLHAKADSLSVESLLRSSFREAARNTQRPVMKRNLKRCNKASSSGDHALAALPPINCVFGCPTMGEFAEMQREWRRVAERVHMKVWQCRQVATSIFTLGRLVYVHSLSDMIPSSMPAVIINIDFVPLIQGEPPTFCMLVLLPPRYSLATLEAQAASGSGVSLPFACAGIGARGSISSGVSMGASWGAEVALAEIEDLGGGDGRLGGSTEWVVLKGVSLNCVEQVLDRRLTPPSNFLKKDTVHLSTLATELSRAVGDEGGAVGVRWEELLPKMDLDFVQPLLKYNELQKSMSENQCATCELKEQHLALAARRMQLEQEAAALSEALNARSLDLYPDMRARQRVLKRYGLVQEDGTPTLKGRVACQIISGDELTLAEFIFHHGLEGLSVEEIAAVLSAFVGCDREKSESPSPTPGVQDARVLAETLHTQILIAQKQEGLRVADEDWWRLCNFELSLVAYEWARGAPFANIMRLTTLHEGSIVRGLLRLDELLRKLGQAMTLTGNVDLVAKLQSASEKIRRDIVFTTSLYLQ